MPLSRFTLGEDSDRLALIARHTHYAVILADREGRIEWVNEGFCQLTGYSLEEVYGKTPGSVLQGPDTDPETVALMREGIASGKGFHVEVLNYSKSGKPYWLELEVRPICDPEGNFINFMAIQMDVTERRRNEQKLRQAIQFQDETSAMAQVGGWELNLATGTPRWTPMVARIHECPPDYQPNLEAAINFYAPEARPVIHELVERAMSHGESFDVELPLIRRRAAPSGCAQPAARS
jgi:PAS domain S-box-containing protein